MNAQIFDPTDTTPLPSGSGHVTLVRDFISNRQGDLPKPHPPPAYLKPLILIRNYTANRLRIIYHTLPAVTIAPDCQSETSKITDYPVR
jgi:hypothetical protein